jgi:FAD dependent oxidoreductase
LTTSTTKTDSVSMAGYVFDDHVHGLYPAVQGGVQGYITDSIDSLPSANRQTNIYQIPFRAMLPKVTDSANGLVPVAASFSHVAFSSFRIVTQWMEASFAAGYAAGLSAFTSTPLNSLVVSTLQADLQALGQVISFSP